MEPNVKITRCVCDEFVCICETITMMTEHGYLKVRVLPMPEWQKEPLRKFCSLCGCDHDTKDHEN